MSPTRVSGAQVLKSSSAAFPCALAGCWFRSGVVSEKVLQYGMLKWQLIQLHHGAGPCFLSCHILSSHMCSCHDALCCDAAGHLHMLLSLQNCDPHKLLFLIDFKSPVFCNSHTTTNKQREALVSTGTSTALKQKAVPSLLTRGNLG